MNQTHNDSTIGVYKLTSAHQFTFLDLSNLISSDLLNMTNISASVDSLRSLPLGSLATSLSSNYTKTYNQSFQSISNISSSVMKTFRNTRPAVVNSSSQVNSSIYNIVGSMPASVSGTFVTILKYDSYRTYVVAIFFGVS